MKWKIWLLALSVLLLSSPFSYAYAWSANEWLGVIEATAGTVVLRSPVAPSGDTCENCSGTGRLGDGTVSVECPLCLGTGKRIKQDGVKPNGTSLYMSGSGCQQCSAPARMEVNPNSPRKDGSAATHDAHQRGGATSFRRRLFRRR